MSEHVDTLVMESLENKAMIFEILFYETEVMDAVAKLEERKAAGPVAWSTR